MSLLFWVLGIWVAIIVIAAFAKGSMGSPAGDVLRNLPLIHDEYHDEED